MARKKRKPPPSDAPRESQASIFVTIAWSSSVMTTLACAAVALVAWLVVRGRADNGTALVFVRLLHFSAVVTGLVSLCLLPIILKVRREPPPPSLIAVSVVGAALPIIAALF